MNRTIWSLTVHSVKSVVALFTFLLSLLKMVIVVFVMEVFSLFFEEVCQWWKGLVMILSTLFLTREAEMSVREGRGSAVVFSAHCTTCCMIAWSAMMQSQTIESWVRQCSNACVVLNLLSCINDKLCWASVKTAKRYSMYSRTLFSVLFLLQRLK